MCELHNKEARPSSSNEGPKSPPSCAGRRGGMPPGRVAPNGGTRSQGGAVQIGSERAWQRRAGCERADCDTNNAASLKEARVDHSEGGVCVTSIQGGVQRRNLVSATIWRLSRLAAQDGTIRGGAAQKLRLRPNSHRGTKMGFNARFGVSGHSF